MKEMAVAQHRVAIGRRAEPPARRLYQIFEDGAGLGDDPPAGRPRSGPCRGPRSGILDHRRLAERMDAPQRRGSEHGLGIALVPPHLVGQFELLEQPQHALRAAVLEMMDDDHLLFRTQSDATSLTSLAARTAVTPFRSRLGLYSTISAPTMGARTRSSTASSSRTLSPPGSWCDTPGAKAGSRASRSTLR